MTLRKENKEQILMKALELYDAGKTPSEILECLPKYKKEISEIIETAELLKSVRNEINPSKTLVTAVLASTSAEEAIEKQIALKWQKILNWRLIVPALSALAILLIFIISSPGAVDDSETSLFVADPFELRAIQNEFLSVGFDPELDNFFTEEKNLEEVDIVLTNL